jgi:hypothetical protein
MTPAATPPAPDVLEDDDPETMPCYRHPDRLTALQCITCDRPICSEECAIQAAVGFKCPDDARISRAARGVVPRGKLALGAVAGLVTALVLGGLLALFGIGFFGILLGYAIGMATGIVARKASGGYRDPFLANVAAGSAALGIVLLPLLDVIGGAHPGIGFVFKVMAGIAGAVAAHQRALE